MVDERRFIVYGSQGSVDDADSPGSESGAGGTGDANNPGQTEPDGHKSGQTHAGGGSKDPGKSGSDPGNLADDIWAKATGHYKPKLEKLEKELAQYRREKLQAEAKAKTADQLAAEIDDLKARYDRQQAVASSFAESRVKNLPDHLQKLVEKAAGGDPVRVLEVLPDFEDLARRTTLKTIGGNAGGSNLPNIDYQAIREAQSRGDMRPYREAIQKHGEKAYQDGLQRFFAERGR